MKTNKLFNTVSAVQWSPAPEGAKCLNCDKETLERSVHFTFGPWAGTVRCTTCGHHESLMDYLGKTKVEPRNGK